MFVDNAVVKVKAGDGGNGIVSFRHEKFVDKGGPDGGDGGDGGNVIFVASEREHTLANYRHVQTVAAEDGGAGNKRKQHGRNGQDKIVFVPVGTQINKDDAVMADLVADGQRVIVAKGGPGGYGNAHFSTSRRQSPRVAEKGEPGEEFVVTLELKMIADIGLVGLPNAGKSTLLSVVSNARPEIANYPFTTLLPNLGMVPVDDETSLLFADIPGLIEGAAEGKGLGDDFLRHVERTKVLVHLIDCYNEDVVAAYTTIMKELAAYKIDLSQKPMVVALTKVEGVDGEMVDDAARQLKTITDAPIFALSSKTKDGVKELLYELKRIVAKQRVTEPAVEATDAPVVITLADNDKKLDDTWIVEKTKTGYRVSGQKIERFARRTDFASYHGQQRLRDILGKMGIMRELERQGIDANDTISFGDPSVGKLEY